MSTGTALANNILNDPTSIVIQGNSRRYGGNYIDIISDNGKGMGVRYSESTVFVGFLEPGFMQDAVSYFDAMAAEGTYNEGKIDSA